MLSFGGGFSADGPTAVSRQAALACRDRLRVLRSRNLPLAAAYFAGIKPCGSASSAAAENAESTVS
jgi:hypothetical protein